MTRPRLWLICMTTGVFVAVLHAETFVVDAGGGGTHTTISSAISASVDGDEIVVMPGVYVETIDFGGRAIRVRGTAPMDAAVVAGTVIDGNESGSVVTFANGETKQSVLSGLTITGGRAAEHGGGILCVNGASPTIVGNHIRRNQAMMNGAGLYFMDASPTILDNVFLGNEAELRGGAIFGENGSALIEDNEMRFNAAGCNSGGGVHLGVGTDDSRLVGNTIVGNASRLGGGLAVNAASPRIERNRFIHNVSFPRAGAVSFFQSDSEVVSNVIAGNRSQIAAAFDFNQSDVLLRSNTIVGNHALDAGICLFIGGSQGELVGNIFANNLGGVAVQALAGGSATVDYSNFFGNPAGNVTGTVTEGPNNLALDPEFVADGEWVFSGLTLDDDDGPVCEGGIRVELVATMLGDGGARASAYYRIRPGRERFDVAVQNAPAGSYPVVVRGVQVATINVGGNGTAFIGLDTGDGNFPGVFPDDIRILDAVSVGNVASGVMGPSLAGLGDIWLIGDEHLGEGSALRDRGPASTGVSADLDGQPRCYGDASDIGADELVPSGSGDGDEDADVDFADVGLFQLCHRGANRGLATPDCYRVDLDGDADVDIVDWEMLMERVTGP